MATGVLVIPPAKLAQFPRGERSQRSSICFSVLSGLAQARMGPCSRSSRPRARHTLTSAMLGTHLGHWTLLGLAGAFLILSGALAWMAAGRCDPDDDDDACLELADPDHYLQALWLAWGIFFDPGTQTGLPPNAPARHKLVLLAFSTCGFVFNLVVLGLIVSTLQDLLGRWERLHRVIVANDHTVILGWTDKTLFSIGEQPQPQASPRP